MLAAPRGLIIPVYKGKGPNTNPILSPLHVGRNTDKWDRHQDMINAVDEYRTRRLKAASFLLWTRVWKAHKTPENLVFALEEEIEDLLQRLQSRTQELEYLEGVVQEERRKQRETTPLEGRHLEAVIHSLEQRLQVVEEGYVVDEQNAFFFLRGGSCQAFGRDWS